MMPYTSPTNPNIHPTRVILVDDVARVRHELGELLALTGVVQVVGEAGDGAEAIRLAAEVSPDVIVMDLEMPGMDGLEATRRIKVSFPVLRVVILSIHAGLEVEERARAAGADSFIVKGTDYQILVNAIREENGPNRSNEKGEKS